MVNHPRAVTEKCMNKIQQNQLITIMLKWNSEDPKTYKKTYETLLKYTLK
jgi:hypothetical protein